MLKMVRILVSRTLFVVIASAAILAQGGATGAITGIVQDASGAVIAGAEIRVTNQDTGTVVRSVVTNSTGGFAAQLLPVATYSVSIKSKGFAEERLIGVAVRVTETTRLTVKLQPASVTQQVDVTAETPTVETTTATTGQSIEAATIRSLPLATQNFQQLLTLSSGAASELNNSASLGRGVNRITVNGARDDNNNYQIEGISASDYNVASLTNTPLPSPDVVQEFKVQTSLYDASQGRNSGGNINAILKSGTRQFHGSAFEFFRNTALNANEYFLKGQGQQRPDIKQNIFGGSLGGPVSKEGKLGFFFVNYQGTRQRSGLSDGTLVSTIIPTIPTDRSAGSLESFFNIPEGAIDPVSLKLLQLQGNQFGGGTGGFLIPSLAPNDPSLPTERQRSNFTFSRPGKYTDDQFTANYDKDFRGGSDHFAARFFFSNFESNLPFGAGGLQATLGGGINSTDLNFPLDLPVKDRFLNLTETHIFSPRLLNEFRFGFVHIDNNAVNTPIVTVDQLGIDRPNSNLYKTIYKFTFPGFQIGPTPGADQSQNQNNLTFLDTVSWTVGRHRLRIGGQLDRVILDKVFPQVFNGQTFFAPGISPLDGETQYDEFQNFLIGAPFFSFGGSGVANHQYRFNDIAAFAQDDLNLTPNLTLNLGLRFEAFGAPSDNLHHIGNTISSLANQGISPFVFPKGVNSFNIPGFSGDRSETVLSNDYAKNWGPRIGFAWDVFGKHKTAVRGGVGIFYVKEDVGTVDQMSFTAPILPITFASGPPGTLGTLFSTGPGRLPVGGVIDPSFVPSYSHFLGFFDSNGNKTQDTVNGSPAFDGNTISLFGLEVPQRFISPSTQQWNLTVQQQLPGSWIFEAGYVGAHGIHLRETRGAIEPFDARTHPVTLTDVDGVSYTITQNTVGNANARSRGLGLAPSGYQLFANDAYSHFNSLQLSLSRHFSKGLYFQGAYTFAKSTDATSSGNTAFNTAVNSQASLDPSRGLSDFDRPQRLIVSYTWELPFFAKTAGAAGHLLRGWSISGVSTFQSGVPFSVIDSAGGTSFTPSSSNQSLASLAHGATIASGNTSGDIHKRLSSYLNLGAFSPAPIVGADGSTGFGDLHRNTYRGPHQQNWDFTIARNFRITEKQRLKFGGEFFNLFNHPNFGIPGIADVAGGTASATSFAPITKTTGTPRLIQFTLRYSF